MPEIITHWGLEPSRLRSEIKLCGSPERCSARYAVEDAEGRVWVVERLFDGQEARRERISALLAHVHARGVAVAPYLALSDGGHVLGRDGEQWQLSPFIQGDSLPQPQFIEDGQRGENLASFIVSLRRASEGVAIFEDDPGFSLPAYVDELMATMELRHPDLFGRLRPVRVACASVLEAWPELPSAICQGDFHPLNVIWRGQSVAAVIDWEFASERPELYDAANCLGCVGIEDPNALVRGLAAALLQGLRDRLDPAPESLAHLPGLLLALRFAWMSEWLRRDDREMVQLELDYMTLLANNLKGLSNYWKL